MFKRHDFDITRIWSGEGFGKFRIPRSYEFRLGNQAGGAIGIQAGQVEDERGRYGVRRVMHVVHVVFTFRIRHRDTKLRRRRREHGFVVEGYDTIQRVGAVIYIEIGDYYTEIGNLKCCTAILCHIHL